MKVKGEIFNFLHECTQIFSCTKSLRVNNYVQNRSYSICVARGNGIPFSLIGRHYKSQNNGYTYFCEHNLL